MKPNSHVQKRKEESARRFLELCVPVLGELLGVEKADSFEVADNPTAAMLDEAGIDGALILAQSRHGLFYASRTLRVAPNETWRKSLRLAHSYDMPKGSVARENKLLKRLVFPKSRSVLEGRDREMAPERGHVLRASVPRRGGMIGPTVIGQLCCEYGSARPNAKVVNLHSEVSKILYHQSNFAKVGSVVPNYHVTTWYEEKNGEERAKRVLVVSSNRLAELVWRIFDTATGDGHYLFAETAHAGGLLRFFHANEEPPYYLTDTEFVAFKTAIANGPYGNHVDFQDYGSATFLRIDVELLLSEADTKIWSDD